MCAPYFVNLNNNTFQLKRYYSLFIYVRGKRERKKSSPIISLRYSELSWDLSSGAVCLGVDSPGSVPGPPQRQRSWQCASCAEVHCVVAVKMSVVKCKLPMLLWLPSYLFTSTTFEYIWSVDLNLLYYDVTTELILVYIAPHYVIFKDPFLWSPYVIGRPYIFSCCGLFFFFFLSFFFPCLISAAADWMSTILRHMVWS